MDRAAYVQSNDANTQCWCDFERPQRLRCQYFKAVREGVMLYTSTLYARLMHATRPTASLTARGHAAQCILKYISCL
jgi:hypothetical protein